MCGLVAEIWILSKWNKFCFGNIIVMISIVIIIVTTMTTIRSICSGAVRLISPVFCIFKDVNFKRTIL